MGGRGGYSGKYAGIDRGSLERMKSRYQSIADSNRVAATLDPNSPYSSIRRRQKAAAKALNNAVQEIIEINSALKYAKKSDTF